MEDHLLVIGHIIQISVAPVFLLAGVGTKLTVLTNRLGRIIDRSRSLQTDETRKVNSSCLDENAELATLSQRAHLINRAITLSTVCGLLICLVIASLFIGALLNIDFGQMIALLFILSMGALVGSFVYFLREIFLAIDWISLHGVFER